MFWVFSFFCQELSQVKTLLNKNFAQKQIVYKIYFKLFENDGEPMMKSFASYFSDGWNQFDMLGILLFLVGMILRIVSLYKNEELFRAARFYYLSYFILFKKEKISHN